jgi:hypothetical protein
MGWGELAELAFEEQVHELFCESLVLRRGLVSILWGTGVGLEGGRLGHKGGGYWV